MSDERKYWLDEPRNVTRLYVALLVVCALLVVTDLILHRHADFSWEGLPGFYGAFGFVAFFGIVMAGKHLRKLLKRPEDYYDR